MNVSRRADDTELIARAYLSAVVEPPAPALIDFIAEHGASASAERVIRGEVPAGVMEEVRSRREHVRGVDVLDRADREGIRPIIPEHAEWPVEAFADLSAATTAGIPGLAEPVALWARGSADLRKSCAAAVAVVGARAATGYGETLAAEFGHGLTNAGITVVSGAAYGIDGAAHRGALAANGTTIAVLACGPDLDYPAGHARLLAEIASSGIVLSEYPPGVPPRKHRFLVRNRLIAAATRGTVVVEAGARSGATNTASSADALGRQVMAVPGPVTSANSVGCHAMVRSARAVLVTGPREVLELVTEIGSETAVDEPAAPARATDRLDERSRRIHDVLGRGDGHSAEQLARETGLPAGRVNALLTVMEMSGFVVFGERGWRRCTA